MVKNKIKYFATSGLKSNNRDFNKPNEDYVLYNVENGIYILLDGITRVHSEYSDGNNFAFEVDKLFATTVYEYLLQRIKNIDDSEVASLLRSAVVEGNSAVAEYRNKKTLPEWVYYPATLGLIVLIHNKQLHYICAGDCLGTIIRGSSKLYFGEQQTIKAIELNNISKDIRYSTYCNHPDSPFPYAIFNGDDSLIDAMEQSFIDLHSGDVIILATDGLGNYVKFEKSEVLCSISPEEMIEYSVVYDKPPYAKYSDDKAIIKISCA